MFNVLRIQMQFPTAWKAKEERQQPEVITHLDINKIPFHMLQLVKKHSS